MLVVSVLCLFVGFLSGCIVMWFIGEGQRDSFKKRTNTKIYNPKSEEDIQWISTITKNLNYDQRSEKN